MRASMAMRSGLTRMRMTKIECALLAAVLGMFASGFAHAETAAAGAAKSGRQAAPPPAGHADPHAKPAPPTPSTRPVPSPPAGMTQAGPAPTTVTPMQNPHAVAVPRVTATTSAAATGPSGASGNTVGRRASGTAIIGGPARYDAKHGAVVGGTVTGRKR